MGGGARALPPRSPLTMILRNTHKKFSELDLERDKFKVRHVERISDDVLKDNYALRKDKDSTYSYDRQTRLVARIPTITWMEWYRKYPELSDSDPAYRDKFLWKLLNSQENEVFKTVASKL